MDDTEPSDGALTASAIEDAAASVRIVERWARVLAVMPYIAGAIWLVALVSGLVANWVASNEYSFSEPVTFNINNLPPLEGERVARVLFFSLASTWPYLAIAVVAAAFSALIETRRLPYLMQQIGEDDEDEDED